jgi:hypothetical protein
MVYSGVTETKKAMHFQVFRNIVIVHAAFLPQIPNAPQPENRGRFSAAEKSRRRAFSV